MRMLGVVVLLFGLALVYFTYSNATGQGIDPIIITVNYGLGLLLSGVGLLATFAKFK